MSSQPTPVQGQAPAGERNFDELERRAEVQRQRVSRDVAKLRHNMQRELDVRGRVEDGIHTHPGAFYGAAAGAAWFVGYLIARVLKA